MVPWGANLLQFSSSVSKCVRPPLQFNWTPRTLGVLFWSLSSPSLLSCTTTPSLTQLHRMFPISCKENDRPVKTYNDAGYKRDYVPNDLTILRPSSWWYWSRPTFATDNGNIYRNKKHPIAEAPNKFIQCNIMWSLVNNSQYYHTVQRCWWQNKKAYSEHRRRLAASPGTFVSDSRITLWTLLTAFAGA